MMGLVIGVGNRWRSDDGVGPRIADELAALGVPATEHSGEGAGLIDAWSGRPWAVVVDAMRSGAEVGTVRRIDAIAEELPRDTFHRSSHLFGVAEAVETARVLGRLPDRLVIFGIEGGSFSFGDRLCPAVEAAVAEVVGRIRVEFSSESN